MVINWIKYNAPNNVNTIKCVNKELSKVKHKEFLKILFKKCQVAGLDVDEIFKNVIIKEPYQETSVDSMAIQELRELEINKPLGRDLQGPHKGLPSNRIRSNKEEVIKKKQKAKSKEEEVTRYENNTSAADYRDLKHIIEIFEENVHAISPLEYEKLLDFSKVVSSEVIIMAIEEAVNYIAKTMKYITQVLSSWISSGIKTSEEVKAYQNQWANKKSSRLKNNVNKSKFCDYEQRSYDFDALEKKLLGHMDNDNEDF